MSSPSPSPSPPPVTHPSPAPPSSTAAPPHPLVKSRRPPPPCWSFDETVALIESYRDKWCSLRRNNLKATHWEEVADAVFLRCPSASPRKTALQCRHKMEKLRKRYRTEIQRSASLPASKFCSSWVHFRRMDEMEKGPKAAKPKFDRDEGDNDSEDDEVDSDHDRSLNYNGSVGYYPQSIRNGNVFMNTKNVHKLYNDGVSVGTMPSPGSVSGGFRMGIPTGVSIARPVPPRFYTKVDPNYANFGPNLSNVRSYSGGGSSNKGWRGNEETGKKREREREVIEEMVNAIKVLGDVYVRIETMKMDMAREFEAMRMEMEMKRTRMIMHSQQQMVEAIANVFADRRKKRRTAE